MCTRKVLTKERLDGNPVREHTAKLLEVFAEHRGMDLARENTIYCWKCGENCCSLVTNPYRRLIWRPEVSCGTEIIQRCPLMMPWQRLVSLLLVSRVQLGWFELSFPVRHSAQFTFWRSLFEHN